MNKQVQRHIQTVQKAEKKSRPHIVVGLLQGIGWAFGATIGFALVIAIVSFIASKLGWLPVIGDIFQGLSDAINQFSQARQTLPR